MEGVAVITVVPAGVLTPPIEDTGPPRVALDGGVAAVGIWGGGGVGLSSISSSEERGGVGVSPRRAPAHDRVARRAPPESSSLRRPEGCARNVGAGGGRGAGAGLRAERS